MNNINESELNKFNQLSQKWWDPNGPLKTLHQINPLRLEFIQEHCSLANKTILDVGCGGGILTESLSEHCAHITGLDMADDLLSVAKHHAEKNSLLTHPPVYYLDTAENYAQEHPNTFDVITCMEMLEHVPSPFSILESLGTLLKTGGDLFCSTLNRHWMAYCQAIIGAEYILKLLPRGTHDYQAFIKPSELVFMAKKAGFQLQAITGLSYNPFKRVFYLTPDVRVNYLIYFKKI